VDIGRLCLLQGRCQWPLRLNLPDCHKSNFEGDRLEAHAQRRYIDRLYDLWVDGVQVVPIEGQQDWSKVQPGTKVVLMVIFLREQSINVRRYKRPRWKIWNDAAPSNTASIDWSVESSPLFGFCDGRNYYKVKEATPFKCQMQTMTEAHKKKFHKYDSNDGSMHGV